jgi:hypothetical protein
MTIAINLKVNDGVVLAADSASTLVAQSAGSAPPVVIKVYNNANKIINLYKGLPIGMLTWGSGSIGVESIETLGKDLRSQLTDGSEEWRIKSSDYQILEIAQRVKKFFYDERYVKTFESWANKPPLGFMVAGYSREHDIYSSVAEEYSIQINAEGSCFGPTAIRKPGEVGVTWNGFVEPLTRLILGFAPSLPTLIGGLLPDKTAELMDGFNRIRPQLGAQLVQPAMPLQDAIDLADYLADLAVNFSRFFPGAAIVGGPIEIAAITKHEGFKWVTRKYYFDRALNPEVSNSDGK